MDPFDLFADSPAPYCWYGITPTLFDAPSRLDTRPMNWTAHFDLVDQRGRGK
ncbi:hypothetical protein ABNF97_18970 [Plantactinospora sp. B6F1]|uniref:hypothetical protein n=1 Tax=Plantactinospora sp. B6F1 TaxID=3158971 RepID=UPI0010D90A27